MRTLALLLGSPALLLAAAGYDSYLTGNPADAPARNVRPGLILMGGGKDVPEAFRWLIDRSGGGDIVIVRASGADGYHKFLTQLGGADSIETFVIRERAAASDPAIVDKVRHAEAVWIAGGDQWNYMRLWAGTPLGEALRDAARRVPFGGTSAGLAVLGEWVFTAEFDTITSADAEANPADRRITIARGFLEIPQLRGILTDSHFTQRHREGRLRVFLTKAPGATGIGIDEATALLLTPEGEARVVGTNAVHVYPPGNAAPVDHPAGSTWRWPLP